MRKHLGALAVGAFLLVATIVALLGSLGAFTRDTAGGEFVTTPPPAAGADLFPGMAVSFTGSGKFRVPEQAPPGEYAVTSTSGTFGCSWWILKADDGKPRSEISAGTFNRAGFDTLTIPASARWLKLLGDCTLRAAP